MSMLMDYSEIKVQQGTVIHKSDKTIMQIFLHCMLYEVPYGLFVGI
jgi:hypothetical protein